MTGVLSLKNFVRNIDKTWLLRILTCFTVPKAEELIMEAEMAERERNIEKASELYMYDQHES